MDSRVLLAPTSAPERDVKEVLAETNRKTDEWVAKVREMKTDGNLAGRDDFGAAGQVSRESGVPEEVIPGVRGHLGKDQRYGDPPLPGEEPVMPTERRFAAFSKTAVPAEDEEDARGRDVHLRLPDNLQAQRPRQHPHGEDKQGGKLGPHRGARREEGGAAQRRLDAPFVPSYALRDPRGRSEEDTQGAVTSPGA